MRHAGGPRSAPFPAAPAAPLTSAPRRPVGVPAPPGAFKRSRPALPLVGATERAARHEAEREPIGLRSYGGAGPRRLFPAGRVWPAIGPLVT